MTAREYQILKKHFIILVESYITDEKIKSQKYRFLENLEEQIVASKYRKSLYALKPKFGVKPFDPKYLKWD